MAEQPAAAIALGVNVGGAAVLVVIWSLRRVAGTGTMTFHATPPITPCLLSCDASRLPDWLKLVVSHSG